MEKEVGSLMDKASQIRAAPFFQGKVDSITAVENRVTSILMEGLHLNPESMKYPFMELRRRLVKITGSPDGRLRIYSWDTEGGGTQGSQSSLIQYRTATGIHVRLIFDANNDTTGDPGERYARIFQMTTGKRLLYLLVWDALESSSVVASGIRSLEVVGDKLVDSAKKFVGEDGLAGELFIEYNYFSYLDHGKPEIHFDPVTGTVYIPRTGDHGSIRRQYDRYIFDGHVFKRK
jgi:hypothetical protein